MIRLYIALCLLIVAIAALFRWRAQGVRNEVTRLELEDAKRAQQIRDAANVSRKDHPDSIDRAIERLRAAGRLRADD